MNARHGLVLLVFAVSLIAAGLTLRFGWWGLVVPGAVMLGTTLLFVDFEDRKEVKRDG